jgi:Flp pilus assembly protein TadD
MRVRSFVSMLALTIIASPAFADYGTPPPPPQPTPSPTTEGSNPAEESALSARKEAEGYYSDGYKDVVKAGKELEKGKKDTADKKYRRALERCQRAVELDSTYYEAWNLVGFTSRKLGDYPHAFEAYRTALRLKPDYALAREYYGEGLLETGDIAGAKQQLEALRASGTPELVAELEGAITKYMASHTMSAPAPPAAADTLLTPPTAGKK